MKQYNSANLISVTYTNDGYGKKVPTETLTSVLVTIESVGRAEFFSAFQQDMKSEYKVKMFAGDYNGQTMIEINSIRYDIYRTYEDDKNNMELYLTKKNTIPRVATLWCGNKVVKLHEVYFSGTNGTNNITTGKIATDTFTMILPQNLKAFDGTTQVALMKPKAYKALVDKTNYFFIDSTCFFAIGDITTQLTKYQDINETYDDVYRVQAVTYKNNGTLDTEYIEVTGK